MSESGSKEESKEDNGVLGKIDDKELSGRKKRKMKDLSKVTQENIWLLDKTLEEELAKNRPKHAESMSEIMKIRGKMLEEIHDLRMKMHNLEVNLVATYLIRARVLDETLETLRGTIDLHRDLKGSLEMADATMTRASSIKEQVVMCANMLANIEATFTRMNEKFNLDKPTSV
jgi:hypothetical protein